MAVDILDDLCITDFVINFHNNVHDRITLCYNVLLSAYLKLIFIKLYTASNKVTASFIFDAEWKLILVVMGYLEIIYSTRVCVLHANSSIFKASLVFKT